MIIIQTKMNDIIKKAYLGFTDILDRHEDFNDDDIKEYVGICLLALEGFESEMEWCECDIVKCSRCKEQAQDRFDLCRICMEKKMVRKNE